MGTRWPCVFSSYDWLRLLYCSVFLNYWKISLDSFISAPAGEITVFSAKC